jgi:hypothetical protein
MISGYPAVRPVVTELRPTEPASCGQTARRRIIQIRPSRS